MAADIRLVNSLHDSGGSTFQYRVLISSQQAKDQSSQRAKTARRARAPRAKRAVQDGDSVMVLTACGGAQACWEVEVCGAVW